MLKRNVLIFHAGALGDFVLTWALGLALGRLYPQSRIIYVTQQSKGRLAEKVLGLDWRDAESGWHGLYAAGGEVPEPAGRTLAGAHTVISYVAAPGDEWTQNVERLTGGATIIHLQPNPPADWDEHATRWVLRQLEPHQVIHSAMEQLLRSVAERGVTSRPPAGGQIVIHPGSGSPAKCWPTARFVELIERLKGQGRPVRVVIGEVEAERWSAQEIAALEKVAPVARPGSYLELLDILAPAGVFVGNDSGPGHLAGALGVPSVILFGPTDPTVWRPWGPRVTTVRHEPLAELDVAAVEKLIAKQ